MRVAASSPAWLTRRADERKARCSAVRGFLPLEELVDLEFGGGDDGLVLGVVEGLLTCEELVSGEAGEERKRAAHCRTCLVAARAGLVAGRSIMAVIFRLLFRVEAKRGLRIWVLMLHGPKVT
jgi:hypothetical protein